MSVDVGQHLLHYRLVEKIGEGGMGIVWRAVDTTLDREVAIKILPGGFAEDPERMARFEREAKLLASLNHPNIAGVYGLDEADGVRFIAMEHVPGEDLAQRVASGAFDLDEALSVARQVAAALAAAHDQGIVHRDLKPGNVRLTLDGTVKVLDFGLAKALAPSEAAASGEGGPNMSPTITSAGTRAGMILGTAAYMSPEQARGKPVDRRADIWAFGCVLYEMLTSRQAFSGETVTDVLAAILTREVDLEPLEGRVPRRLLRVLRRCLTKDPSKRLRDAGDIGLELDAVLAGDRSVDDVAAEAPRRSWGVTIAVAVVAMLLGAAAIYLAGGGASRGEDGPRRLTVTAGDRPIRDATISRDGRLLVLALEDGAYVRPLDRYELQPIPDSAELTSWVESPDGRSIAFFTTDDQILGGGTLRRMSFETGTTVTLHSSGEGMNPLLWLDDGILVHGQDSIRRVQLESNEVEVVMELERGHSHRASAVPGGKALLIELHDPGGEHEWSLNLIDLAERTQRNLVPDARSGVVTTSGHLLFLRDDTLIGSRFDPKALATVGEPVPLVSGVRSFSVSEEGTLAYLPMEEGASISRAVRVNRAGQADTVYEGQVLDVRYAPDGRWISAVADREFLLVDPRNGSVRPLLYEGFRFSDHVWRADSTAVVYTAYPLGEGSSRLVEHPIDGSAPRVLLDPEEDHVEVFPTGYAPDGSGFIFARYDKNDTNLWWMPADGKEPRELLATGAFEDLARFAPNGRWVAYESTESGRQEVWVAVFRTEGPRLAEKWKISQQGGRDPIWSVDGTELYYETFDGRLVAVAVASDPDGRPSFGQRDDLLDLRALGVAAAGDESYDVAPDGSGWVAVQGGSAVSNEVRVVLNWFSELERLVKDD